ncbi:hypothetical protein PQR02_30100 [Paraburkholderia sediminicola]|uniref:Uncharacterized protein n=1 Tax=Paraburkholderia rhynchosiae TaxID=487049 RepID=A0ACC7NI44_9BURK
MIQWFALAWFTLIGSDSIARPLLKDAHEWLGNVFHGVIDQHALSAIAHHVVFKDPTLRRIF